MFRSNREKMYTYSTKSLLGTALYYITIKVNPTE